MKKLLQGIVDFGKNLTEEKRILHSKLALENKPQTLFIACSDSRVVPNLFASTNPGDLFVLRNIGNLIPPAHRPHEDSSAAAILEFSILSLKITDIIVCGHSECAAMRALAGTLDLDVHNCAHVQAWLKNGADASRRVQEGFVIDPSHSKHNQISQVNVLQQIEHIKSYPFVKDLLDKKKIRIHAWWYDIAKASVYNYNENFGRYVLIDESEAQSILDKLNSEDGR